MLIRLYRDGDGQTDRHRDMKIWRYGDIEIPIVWNWLAGFVGWFGSSVGWFGSVRFDSLIQIFVLHKKIFQFSNFFFLIT